MRKLLLGLIATSLGAFTVWAQWGPGAKLDDKFGDLRESFRDAVLIMSSIIKDISSKEINDLYEKRASIEKQITKELDGQFRRVQGLLKKYDLEGLRLSSLSEADIKLLFGALPPEAKQIASKDGVLSTEGVVNLFEDLRQRTSKEGKQFLTALDGYRKTPKGLPAYANLVISYGDFVKECSRNMAIVVLLQNVTVAPPKN